MLCYACFAPLRYPLHARLKPVSAAAQARPSFFFFALVSLVLIQLSVPPLVRFPRFFFLLRFCSPSSPTSRPLPYHAGLLSPIASFTPQVPERADRFRTLFNPPPTRSRPTCTIDVALRRVLVLPFR